MKFTKEFVEILKNFSTISSQMKFVPGAVQSVKHEQGTSFAIAETNVEIPESFSIFSLQKLLSVLSLFDEPEIDINDRFLVINSTTDKRVCNYQLTNPDFIVHESNTEKYGRLRWDISFGLQYVDFSNMLKFANILKSEFIIFRGDGEKIYLEANNSNGNGDSGAIELGETEHTFKVVLNRECLNLLDEEYQVMITKKGIISFQSPRIKYYFAFIKKESSV